MTQYAQTVMRPNGLKRIVFPAGRRGSIAPATRPADPSPSPSEAEVDRLKAEVLERMKRMLAETEAVPPGTTPAPPERRPVVPLALPAAVPPTGASTTWQQRQAAREAGARASRVANGRSYYRAGETPLTPDELRRRRVGAGLSQRELAVAAGLSRGLLGEMEAGRRRGSVGSWALLVAVLNEKERAA